ncbi:transposable element Tcb2 transposase [Trichonephila clavipes]|uniref:Transposable element Tcb2 transposase n=1 Tax=Trichonephila clavipes TaxID=2585209 RepID=A0A8X6V5B0_TRICX|nr:transposable element Tcb2 transposase [Trichonephila clavipes]
MDWPAYSPDLNPIEHVWDMFGRRIAVRQPPPTCLPELWRALLDEWCNISQDQIDNLILSMLRRYESRFNLWDHDGRIRVRRYTGWAHVGRTPARSYDRDCLLPTVKFGGRLVTIWAAVSLLSVRCMNSRTGEKMFWVQFRVVIVFAGRAFSCPVLLNLHAPEVSCSEPC